MLALEDLVGLHRTVQLLQHYWLGHRLGLLCYIEWFALEMNRDDSVIFEIASNYCISDSSVDYDGKERQCQRMLKLPHNCTHLTC